MRVVVIEPNDAIRTRLVANLRDAGLEVVSELTSVASAVRELSQARANAVLMEVVLDQLPPDCVRAIRAAAPGVRIIVLTNATHYRQRSLAAGADYFLDKSTEFEKVAPLLVS